MSRTLKVEARFEERVRAIALLASDAMYQALTSGLSSLEKRMICAEPHKCECFNAPITYFPPERERLLKLTSSFKWIAGIGDGVTEVESG